MLKALRDFDISIYKLNNGTHSFNFNIDDAFFDLFENSLIKEGDLLTEITLDKNSSHITGHFKINGMVKLICDCSLELFNYPLNVDKKLIFKYGEMDEELSDELYTINRNTQVLNVAQYIYEFIGLEVPIRKIHPKFASEHDDESSFFYSTTEDQENNNEENNEEIDPRWSKLKNLKKE